MPTPFPHADRRWRRVLGAVLFALAGPSCAGEAAPLPPPPPTPAAPLQPPHRGIRRVLDGEPQVVVIEGDEAAANEPAWPVVLRGPGATAWEAQVLPHPAGGAWAFQSVEYEGRIVTRRGETLKDLLLPSGALQGLGGKAARDMGAFVFVERERTFAIVDPATGQDIGARPRDPAHDEDGTVVPIRVALGGKRLIESANLAPNSEKPALRFSRLPSLEVDLVRPGELGGVSGRFALVLVPVPPPPEGVDPTGELEALEIVDLESAKAVERIEIPKALRAKAFYALSPDGGRVARSMNGSVQVYERASKRWTEKRKANHYPEDIAPPFTWMGFTADGKTLCVEHGALFLFPPSPAPAGTNQRMVIDSDRICHLAATPRIRGAEPLVDDGWGFALAHIGGALSPEGDLGAFLDVQPKRPGSGPDDPREVHLTVLELPSNKVRYQIPVGPWVASLQADHLTVDFLPKKKGIWVEATMDYVEPRFGGLFDAGTGKRLAPMSTGPRPDPPTVADLALRTGHRPGPGSWKKITVEEGALVGEVAGGAKLKLAQEPPLPEQVKAWLGGPEGGATLVGDGHVAWIFSSTEHRFLGVLVPSGKGVVALLDGGAFDTAGPVDETRLACLSGSRLLPLSTCRDRAFVAGALADAMAGTRTWLDEQN